MYKKLSASLLAAALLVGSSANAAEDLSEILAHGASTQPAPYRGTSVSYKSVVAARSFAPGAELSYNPYVSSTVAMRLAWWFSKSMYFAGTVNVSREMTNSDWTTARGENVASDTNLTVGASDFWTLPETGIDFSAEGVITLPSSKSSQGETLLMATSANLTMSRNFKVLEGAQVSYTFSPEKRFQQYTTAQYQGPTVLDCANSPGGCGRFYNTGSRNINWSMGHDLSAWIMPHKRLVLSASIGTQTGFLYQRAELEGAESIEQNPVNARFFNYYVLAATLVVNPALDLTFGSSTANPQLRPDGLYRAPLFNRYTNLFVSAKVNMDGLVTELHKL